MATEELIVVGYCAALATGTWLFFGRAPPWRPAIGVFNTWDVALLLSAVVVLPCVYAELPEVVAVAAMAPIVAVVVHHTGRRIGLSRAPAAAVSAAVLTADVAIAVIADERSNVFAAINGVVLALVILGAATFVAASGVSARDVAFLAIALALAQLAVSRLVASPAELLARAGDAPFVPMFGWWDGSQAVGIGLAELLIAALFPLAARKAFGRTAGLAALAISVAAIAAVIVVARDDAMDGWPPIVALGPLVLAQYAYWLRTCGRERRTWEAQRLRHEVSDFIREEVTT
jgi:hypothetical protein